MTEFKANVLWRSVESLKKFVYLYTPSNALLNVYFALPFAIDSVGVNGPPENRRTAYGLNRVDRDKLSYWRT